PDPHLAGDELLRLEDVAPQVGLENAEPQAVVGRLGDLGADGLVEPELVLGKDETLQRAVGGVDDGGGGRLVDLAALDPDEAILDVVDPTHTMDATEGVELLDQRHWRDGGSVEAHRDAALEAEDD